jgi:dipeptidyl-peptidase-4
MSRYEGYWISKDSKMVAFEQVDESHIPNYRIMHQGSDQVGEGAQEDHRYPFAGASNPIVRLGVVGVDGGEVTWFDLTSRYGADLYLPRVKWLHDNTLVVQVQNRDQTEVELLHLFPADGTSKTIMVEKNEAWVNLHNMFTPVKKTGEFIWASERCEHSRVLVGYDLGFWFQEMSDDLRLLSGMAQEKYFPET